MAEIIFEQIDFTKVDLLIKDGRIFRAKQVLDGMSGKSGYHPDIFRKLGDVLMALNEPKQAAKFYFYSGARDPQINGLVEGYHDRLRKLNIPSLKSRWEPIRPLINDMPGALRRSGPDFFPTTLLKDLETVGFETQLFEDWRRSARSRETLVLQDPSTPLKTILRSTTVVAFWAALVLVFFSGFASVGALGSAFLNLIFGTR